jgi:hypothetical protein
MQNLVINMTKITQIIQITIRKFFRWAMFFSLSLATFMGNFAWADFSSDPGSGKDPWALFQLMIGIGTEIWYVIKIVLVISGIVGLIFIILGLLKIRSHALDSQSSGGHLKHGIILVLLGGLLFGAPVLTMLTGNSLFGSAPAPVTTEAQVYCEVVNGEYDDNGNCIPLAPIQPATPANIVVPATPATLNCGPGNVLGPQGCSPCQISDYSASSQSCPCGDDKFSNAMSPATKYPHCPAHPGCGGAWDGSQCWFGPVSAVFGGTGASMVQYNSGAFYAACPSQNANIYKYSDAIASNDFKMESNASYYFSTEAEETSFLSFISNIQPYCTI